jgi:hypothetical protein
MARLLVTGAALMIAVTLSTVAAARGPANEFAAGSAKTEAALFVGDEHVSFSAHNVPGPPDSCDATGHIVYKSESAEFRVKVVELTIIGNAAFFGGPVTKSASGGVEVGDSAYFDVTDSGMPGGTGDTFIFELHVSGVVGTLCFPPVLGQPITKGNIVIKANLP